MTPAKPGALSRHETKVVPLSPLVRHRLQGCNHRIAHAVDHMIDAAAALPAASASLMKGTRYFKS